MSDKPMSAPKLIAPPGLNAIIEQCQKIYPDQPNPLQIRTVLKFWLGGQDPLDYISMYSNPGNPELNVPPHWHYISFGMSDLHGDGRVHLPETNWSAEPRSGMGFELTFRLVKSTNPSDSNRERPPTWPANLLQALARYVFQTGNRLCAGDHVPWRKSLDSLDSQITHMLIAADPQMDRTETPFGWVDYCQIVGVTDEELKQASRWNGKGILNLLKKESTTGGEWLITDMSRRESVFELFPDTLRQLESDLEREGSDLAGIDANFTFTEPRLCKMKNNCNMELLNGVNDMIASMSSIELDDKMSAAVKTDAEETTEPATNSLNISCPFNSQPNRSPVIPLFGIELTLAPYAAKFLVLAIKDRIRHGRHFTFKNHNMAVTFVAESVTGAVVSKEWPYGLLGCWLQVFIPDDLVPKMLSKIEMYATQVDNIIVPAVHEWPEQNLTITIDNIGEDIRVL